MLLGAELGEHDQVAGAGFGGQIGEALLPLSAIGKQLGVSGPALYRYFASRDALTQLLPCVPSSSGVSCTAS